MVCSFIGSGYLITCTILSFQFESADKTIYRQNMLKNDRIGTNYEIHFHGMIIKIFFDNLSYAHFARLLHKTEYNPDWLVVTAVQIIRSIWYIILYSSLETISFLIIFV